MNRDLTLRTRYLLPVCLAVCLCALPPASAGPDEPQGPTKPAPSSPVEPAPRPVDSTKLFDAIRKRDWPAVEKAFQELGPDTSAYAFTVLLGNRRPNAGDHSKLASEMSDAYNSFLERRVMPDSGVKSDEPAVKQALATATQNYVDRIMAVVKAAEAGPSRPPLAAPLGKLEFDAPRAVQGFDLDDLLRLVQAFPYPPSPEAITALAGKCLATAGSPAEREMVIDRSLRALQNPTRHFGLFEAGQANRYRSLLLLYALGGIRQARPFLPPARQVQDWRDADAKAAGIQKADVARLYLSSWNYDDRQGVLLTPLNDVLAILEVSTRAEDASDAQGLAWYLLERYRSSKEKTTHIATRLAANSELATMMAGQAAINARQGFSEASSDLNSFLGTRLNSKPLDESANLRLRAFRKHSREAENAAFILYVLSKALFDSAHDPNERRRVAARAAAGWLALCEQLLDSYESLNQPDPIDSDDNSADRRILGPVARRVAFPVGKLLDLCPTDEMVAELPPSGQGAESFVPDPGESPRPPPPQGATRARRRRADLDPDEFARPSRGRDAVRVMRGKLLGLECRYKEVQELCARILKEDKSEASQIAKEALKTWALPVLNAGRSPEARTRMGDQTPRDYGAFVGTLRATPGLEVDDELVMATFAEFCSGKRPLSEADMEAVLPDASVRSEHVMSLYVAQMAQLLRRDREAMTGAKAAAEKALLGDAQKKAEADRARVSAGGEAKETSAEYQALDAVIARWRASNPAWRGALMRARVLYSWARHQLFFVEQASLAANTDVAGYGERLKESMRLMEEAGKLCQHTNKESGEFESLELLRAWFLQAYVAAAERATKPVAGAEMFARIHEWLDRLPAEEGLAIRKSLATHLARQVFTPDDAGEYARPKDVEVFHLVTGAVALLDDLPEGEEFRKLRDGYRKLQDEIQFRAVPDGSSYRGGHQAPDEKHTFPVGKGEFGVWLTVRHTREARELSGGFRRYAQNQIENPGTALDARATANYANDMKARLKQYLEGLFTVVHVEPLPRPEPLAAGGGAEDRWQETPLYYVILKPAGNVAVTRLPDLPMDLNFVDASGLVVLPFRSEPVALDPDTVDPQEARGLEVEQRLLLHPRNLAEGLVVLEVTTKGTKMVPPGVEELFPGVCPPGFQKEDGPSREEIIKVGFQRGKRYAEVTRRKEIRLRWQGLSTETEFPFPAGRAGAEMQVKHVVYFPDAALGESEGKKVGDTFLVQNLPRHTPPLRYVGWVVAGAVALAVSAWLVVKLLKRTRAPARVKAYTMPHPATALRGVHLLRQMAGDDAVALSDEERVSLQEGIRELEERAMTDHENGQSDGGVTALLRRWVETANNALSRRASGSPGRPAGVGAGGRE